MNYSGLVGIWQSELGVPGGREGMAGMAGVVAIIDFGQKVAHAPRSPRQVARSTVSLAIPDRREQ